MRGVAAVVAHRRTVLGLVVAGALGGLVWRVVLPVTVGVGDSDEVAVGVDLTFAVLGLLAGLATAVHVLRRPGSHVVEHCVVAVLGSLVAGVLAWLVGDQFGRPGMLAHGVLLAWPVATALGLFVAAVVPRSARRLNGSEQLNDSEQLNASEQH